MELLNLNGLSVVAVAPPTFGSFGKVLVARAAFADLTDLTDLTDLAVLIVNMSKGYAQDERLGLKPRDT